MAWIVKDSAHAKIEKRDEPYLSDEMKRHFEAELLPRYATRQAALLPVCHEVQHTYGYLPMQALAEVASFLGLSNAQVLDTVTFYEEFHLQPVGKYMIQICRSIACELCGHAFLSEKVKQKLGIGPGETTDDGKYSFVELECLGACEQAPMCLINEELIGDLTWKKLEAAIDECE
ncbi:MAG: NADH-quinone oxidoreductase subunit NuoE [Phycisphaera sp.]|nr:NADH-quinone oxidoreductase subunit NuoE [Phycisphaera sp.]